MFQHNEDLIEQSFEQQAWLCNEPRIHYTHIFTKTTILY